VARQQVVDSINTILFYQKLFDNSNSILSGNRNVTETRSSDYMVGGNRNVSD
jgi:hypothetical protein